MKQNYHKRLLICRRYIGGWTSALNNHAIQKELFSAQRGVVLRIVSAYRTVSTSVVLILASVRPIGFLAEERKETFQLRKELTQAVQT